MYLLTKTKKPIKDRSTGLPMYVLPVEVRIKRIKAQLNAGLNKHEAIWNDIVRAVKLA